MEDSTRVINEHLTIFGFLTEPFRIGIGSKEMNLLMLIMACLIFVGTIVFSRLLTRFLKRTIFVRANINVGVQASIARVLHYIMMAIGVLISLDYIGFDLTALTALGAVLGVGIGFGLQNLANNFISGLVLLFERPIQVGDFLEVSGVLGTVQAVNARSTTVDTQDHIAIIVPNSHFVSQSVTNWSYRDTKTRIHVRVHVALMSDPKMVEATLLEVARSHDSVLSHPEPRVQFLSFGESALQFDLLVWIENPPQQFFVRSDLNFAIADIFKQRGIEIPFPQRDLHVRSAEGLNAHLPMDASLRKENDSK
ncbi:MAG: mechanosensitive ion channel family protein [Candidatus Latescibacterota bacterium]